MSYKFFDTPIKQEPPYILQGSCKTCEVVTYFNAYIHKHGKPPIEYGTPEYIDFILIDCKGYIDEEMQLWQEEMKPVFKICKVKEFKKNRCRNPKELKAWMIKMLGEKYMIDASVNIRSHHSFLIAEYDSVFDTFKCINLDFFTRTNVVEWLPFEIIYGVKYILIEPAPKKFDLKLSFKNTSRLTKRMSGWGIMKTAKAFKL